MELVISPSSFSSLPSDGCILSFLRLSSPSFSLLVGNNYRSVSRLVWAVSYWPLLSGSAPQLEVHVPALTNCSVSSLTLPHSFSLFPQITPSSVRNKEQVSRSSSLVFYTDRPPSSTAARSPSGFQVSSHPATGSQSREKLPQ